MGEILSGQWAVYVGQEKVACLSTLDSDGVPHATPVFYAMLDGEVYIGTQRTRRKFKNIGNDPRVSVCIDTRQPPYKGILIQGVAQVIDDETMQQRFHEALMYRYYGHPDNPGWQYLQSLGAPALLRIDARQIVTWDFSDD